MLNHNVTHLYTETKENFEPGLLSTTYVCIWTDTGTYVHQYQGEELIKKELSGKVTITEFILLDSQSGKVLNYEIDTDHPDEDRDDPRFTASVETFEVENNTLIFKDLSPEVKVAIDKVTKDELILRFDDGSTSRFVKYETRRQ